MRVFLQVQCSSSTDQSCGPTTLVAIGGRNGGGQILSSVEVMQVLPSVSASKTWSLLNAALNTARYTHGAAVVNNTIYIVGGSSTNDPPNPTVLNSMEAHTVGSSEWVMKASMGVERWLVGVAELEGQVCATGGRDKSGTALSSVECYIVPDDAWSPKASMTQARSHHAAVSLDGYLYVIAGYASGKDLNSVERYSLGEDAWNTVASLPGVARWGVGVATWRKWVFVMGGRRQGSVDHKDVYRYEPGADKWERMADMGTARHGERAAVINDVLYAAGGGGGGSELAVVEGYSLANNTWSPKPNMGEKRHWGVVVAV